MTMVNKDTRVGRDFSGKPKKVTWERLWAFSGGAFCPQGWPKKNIHTDLEFSKSVGLTTVYTSATQYLGYIAEFMLDLFGEQWLRGGKMSNLKFTKPVTVGDTIRVKARVKSKEEGTGVKYTLDVWCENQDGDKVLIGSATGSVQ